MKIARRKRQDLAFASICIEYILMYMEGKDAYSY